MGMFDRRSGGFSRACVLLGALACGESREPQTTLDPTGISVTSASASASASDSDDDGGIDSGDVLDIGNATVGSSADGGEGGDCPCENVLDGIYVLDSNEPPSVKFYDPVTNQFSLVGNLGCDAPLGAVANSMAIDRAGNAWLNYYVTDGFDYTGFLYTAPLSDLGSCTDLGYLGNGSWYLMGMGYSVDGNGSSCDTLFLYNSDQYVNYPDFLPGGSQLAKWVESADTKMIVGPTNYPVGELTGTGDGRLFAFATVGTNQSVLVQLDKADGSEVDVHPLDGLDITNAFAFGFWGGDVYFFTETSPGSGNSKVTRLDLDGTDGGGLAVVNANTGLSITGAGVSTCASFVPPA